MQLSKLGFLLHICIEIPAFVNFILFPSKQLGQLTPHAHPIVRQYALLLLSSIIIAACFLPRQHDNLTSQIAASLAIYHIGPSVRSVSRLRQQARSGRRIWYSEAFLYLVVHLACGCSLLCCFFASPT